MTTLHGFDNIQEFGITVDPWVNTSYFHLLYDYGDRFMDAVDDAKYSSPLNEDEDDVFLAIFKSFRSATTAWIIPRLDAQQAGVVRNDDGQVSRVIREQLRPSGGQWQGDYSPFASVFPTGGMF